MEIPKRRFRLEYLRRSIASTRSQFSRFSTANGDSKGVASCFLMIKDEERKERGSAIALFAKVPEPGKVKTRLAAAVGDEAASEFYSAFVEDTMARISSLPSETVERFLYLASQWNSKSRPLPECAR